MGLQELEEKIRKDAEAEIGLIKKDVEKRIKEIRENYTTEADGIYNEILDKGKRDAFLVGKKIITLAKIDAQRTVTAEKNKIIDQVFTECRRKILELPVNKKSVIMEKLLEDCSMIDGNITLYTDREYRGLIKSRKGMTIKTGDFDDFGVIIESSDGKIRIDNRLGSVLGGMKGMIKPRLNKMLFKAT